MAPWTNKTGLAKATAILATIALVSIGLCGANFVAVITFGSLSGGSEGFQWVSEVLAFAGFAELAGILIGIVGLLIVVVIALIGAIVRLRSGPEQISLRDSESKEE